MKLKKILKVTGITLLIVVIALASAPFLFKDKIIAMIKETINENINATVDFASADISLLRNFPKASIVLEDVSVITKAPFENDTLFYGKEIAVNTAIGELFKGSDEAIQIHSFTITEADVNIKTDLDGNANYDIAKPSETTTTAEGVTETSDFKFQIDDYHIINTDIHYSDAKSKTTMDITNLTHEGYGDFSLKQSELTTNTNAIVSFALDSISYVNKQKINLDAVLDIDLESNTYTFLDNKLLFNQLPLIFDGFVKLNKASQEVELSLHTPSSDFKNFLAVLPEGYAKDIENVQTIGDFKVIGEINGIIDDTHIPKIDIEVISKNASLKYPNLPKGVEDIFILAQLKNTTGNVDDTYVNIDKLAFKIDQDTFSGNGKISQLTANPHVDATLVGKLNLGNITKAYPITLDKKLSGILDADLTTSFDMHAVQNEQYDRIKNTGDLRLTNFVFASKDVVNPLNISSAAIDFKPKQIVLNTFKATSGQSDFNATGTIDDLLGFLFNEDKLKGNFNVQSNTFHVSDFMVASEDGTATTNTEISKGEALKIPSFLDCNISVAANTVHYDNIVLNEVKGKLILADEKAILKDVSSSVFDGKINMTGLVSTQQDTSSFAMDLNMDSFDLSKSFKGLELFQNIAPVAEALNGKLNTKISLSGELSDDYTPNLTTISGDALAELLTATLQSGKNTELFKSINSQLKFIDLNKLNLEDVKTKLSFKDGKVNIKPFLVKYKDIDIVIAGGHGFDKTLDYNLTFQVPAKYLGSEVTSLLSQIKSDKAKKISIPVTTTISGSYTSPSFSTDLASATTGLVKKLIEIKAQEAIGNIKTGNSGLDDLIKDVTGNGINTSDSTQTNTKSPVKDLVNSFFNRKKKKKKDSVKN